MSFCRLCKICPNYLEWIRQRRGQLVDYQFIKDLLGESFDYQAFVLDFLATKQLPEHLAYLDY